ncbi:MAG TPA: RNA polymerase sigma factor [Chitinophagaceae bacterium]|nr:RNA polymerase sigma factor [Chitinophagaceae bacterium]
MELTANIHYNPLVERCKQGDHRSYSELYNQYCKAMFSTCYRLLNNHSEAEDILQEAFTDAFRHLRSFEYKSSFGAWLKQIVVNKCITHLRKNKIRWTDVDSTSAYELPEEEVTDEKEIQYKVREVKEAIQQLPNGYRTVLSLYLLEGYDHEEISEILGITHSTTRTQYKRAKDKLIQLIKQGVTS